MSGDYQNNISGLPNLNEYRYENLFKVYQIDSYYVYNIMNTVTFDKDLDVDYYYEWTVDKPLPWTIISYMHYDTIKLWWLICILNNIINPVQFVETGTVLKIFKPAYVRRLLDQIADKLDS